MISCNGSNAALTLDGSMSFDPVTPNSGLSFQWFDEPSVLALATGEVVTHVVFAVGPHALKLVVTNPGGLTGTDELAVDNITLCDAIDVIMADISNSPIPRKEMRPLLAALKTACTSFSRGKCTAGRQQLAAFIRKVDQQLGPDGGAGPKSPPGYPAEAARFKAGAQAILEANAQAELLGMCACR